MPDDSPVTLVNRFAVTGDPAAFEAAFTATSAYFAERPGFLEHTLLRASDDAARYVNVARWADLASLRAAVGHPDFAAHAAALRALATSEPVVHHSVVSVAAAGAAA